MNDVNASVEGNEGIQARKKAGPGGGKEGGLYRKRGASIAAKECPLYNIYSQRLRELI